MKTPIIFNSSSTASVSLATPRYANFAASGSNVATFGTASAQRIINASRAPMAGKVSMLRVRFPEQLSAGKVTVALMKGGAQGTMAATGLSVEVVPGQTDFSNLVANIDVAEGEYLAWSLVPENAAIASGSTTYPNAVQISCVFESTTPNRQPIHSYVTVGATAGFMPLGAAVAANVAEASVLTTFPISGTIRKMYVSLGENGPPGTGNGRTVTLRKGTSAANMADTPMTVTFGPAEFEKMIDLSGSPVSVAAGDIFTVAHTIVGTPASSMIKVGFEFAPTTAGQAVLFGLVTGAPTGAATRYVGTAGQHQTNEATEANVGNLVPTDMTIKSVRFDAAVAPGAGKSRQMILRRSGADTALSTTLADSALFSAAAQDVSVLAGERINYAHVPSGTPASTTASWWSTVVAIPAGTAPTVLSIAEEPDGHVFEGILAKGLVPLAGTRPAGEPVQVRIETEAGAVVLDYGSTDITISYPTATTWTAVAALDRRVEDMRRKVRLANTPTTIVNGANLFGVGFVIVVNGQSWAQRGSTVGKAPNNGAPTSVTANNVRLAQTIDRDGSPAYRVDRLNAVNRTGSGYTTLADQVGIMLGATTFPVMVHDLTYSGQTLDDWLNDVKPTVESNWRLLSDFLPWGLARCNGRITAIAREVMFNSTKYGNRSAGLDALISIVDGLLTSQPSGKPAEVWILPSWRSPSASWPQFLAAREEMTAKALASPARFKLLAVESAVQVDADGTNHAAWGGGVAENPAKDPSAEAHLAGQIRFFRRIGMSFGGQIQRLLGTAVADIYGAKVVRARYTSAGRTAFDVTLDRDIRIPAGASAPIPQQWVSTGNFASNNTECTGMLIDARTIRVAHPTGGNWLGVTLRYAYLRADMPWQTVNGANGGETAIRTKLNTLVHDTTSYEGGRGMSMEPMTGTGIAVEEAQPGGGPTYTTIGKGATLTLTKAQAATLRVKDGTRSPGTSAEPISLRWERKAGDLTGRPYDGINVPLTVA